MSLVEVGMLSLIEIVGDFSLKEFANNGGIKNLLLGIIGYIGVVYFLIRCLQGSKIILVNTAWDAISSIIETLAAMIFLGESFDDKWQYVGLFLVIIGLFLLRLPITRKIKFKFPAL
jgi:multidrug transporter EmrE-like cation transporter